MRPLLLILLPTIFAAAHYEFHEFPMMIIALAFEQPGWKCLILILIGTREMFLGCHLGEEIYAGSMPDTLDSCVVRFLAAATDTVVSV